MQLREVVLWDAGDVRWDSEDPERRYITDVFHRSARPKTGSLLIGIELATTPGPETGRPSVTVLAMARSAQAVATQKDRVRMEPIVRLEAPVPVDELASRLDPPQRRRFEQAGRPAPLLGVQLSEQLGASVVAALRASSPEAARLLDAWGEAAGVRIDGPRGARLREERDAVQLAIDFARIAPPDEMVRPLEAVPGSLALASAFDDYFVTDIEDDLIAEDLRRFDPKGALELRQPSVARVEDDDFALTIVNVNRKPLEKVLGVDLVYWDEVARVFTLVQYKRMTPQSWAKPSLRTTWAFTRRNELQAQLDRMTVGKPRPAGSADWRLAPSPFWFKFVRAEDFVAGDPWVLRGMYVSAEFLRVALRGDELRDGPRNGFAVTYENTKYLTRETFVELVRRGLVGTTAAGTRRVLEVVTQLAAKDEVILALKTPAPRRRTKQPPFDSLDDPTFLEEPPL